jgi:RNA-directed DNA polymerase
MARNLLRRFGLPEIAHDFELAEWFRIPLNQLQWLADSRGMERTSESEPLRHYRYRLLAKRHGKLRLIECPKPRLKALQRVVLREIVERIPPHPAVHGFRKRRSIKTNAEQHVGKRVVIRLDLEDFFPTITAARVRGLFAGVGYPRDVARLLTGLCTNSAPSHVWFDATKDDHLAYAQGSRYSAPHLPQGAPTSPALANLVAYRMDCRLAGLARSLDATYTRYADDLVFSGDDELARGARSFCASASAIAMEEGFTVNFRKTCVMMAGVRQQVTGVVVNARPNLAREEFDRLKATLTNCIRHGAESQNRDSHPEWRQHLMGRVAHVEMLNAERGEKLQALWRRLEW